MNRVNHNTAILFFTRTLREELKSKSLLANARLKNRLTRDLIEKTRRTLRQTRLRYFEIDSDNQVGKTPNERLDHAVKTIWDKGFSRVIVIGNDCPEMTERDLLQADMALDRASLVVGPDYRGGAYLIGFRREKYQTGCILELPWHTGQFCQKLLQSYPDDHHIIAPLNDINEEEDLRTIFNRTVRNRLVRFLRTYFDQLFGPIYSTVTIPGLSIKYLPVRRGPPVNI
jgi:uncharacterized protein